MLTVFNTFHRDGIIADRLGLVTTDIFKLENVEEGKKKLLTSLRENTERVLRMFDLFPEGSPRERLQRCADQDALHLILEVLDEGIKYDVDSVLEHLDIFYNQGREGIDAESVPQVLSFLLTAEKETKLWVSHLKSFFYGLTLEKTRV
ncbi:MAG: hypothetical protein ACOCQR_03810 [bacterium]